ncbi:MAG: DUF6159 family protein [Thermoplasmata archaeon]
MGRIGRGWALTKTTLRAIRKDREVLIFPVLSGLITLLILSSFISGVFLAFGFEGLARGNAVWIMLALFVAFYFISFFIAIFFNACVIGCAMIRMNGGDPTVSDGLRIAGENIGRIVKWALIAATVGIIIRAVQKRVGLIGRMIIGAVGVAWTAVTYFVVPVLIYERLGPWKAVKRSAEILKRTWGEALVSNLGLGAIFVLFGLLGLLPIALGAYRATISSIIIGVVVAVVYWLILGIIASAARSVLVAALYRYATTGKVSEEFEGVSFARPFTA